MNTKMTLGAVVLLMGTVCMVFAGNKPALTYPEGTLATSSDAANQPEVVAGKKGALQYAKAFSVPGVWYTRCPVMTNIILNSKHSAEVTLSNGKKIMLSSASLKSVVEADLKKYECYMYGSSSPSLASTHITEANLSNVSTKE